MWGHTVKIIFLAIVGLGTPDVGGSGDVSTILYRLAGESAKAKGICNVGREFASIAASALPSISRRVGSPVERRTTDIAHPCSLPVATGRRTAFLLFFGGCGHTFQKRDMHSRRQWGKGQHHQGHHLSALDRRCRVTLRAASVAGARGR